MSKLTKIKLENFMSLPNAEIAFDANNIISIVGYNDSGKSAITRAMEVLWFDAYPQSQVKFITDGRDYFKIINEFDDGVVITRSKYISGASGWEMKKDGNTVYTNKLPNGSFATAKDVPMAIQQYLSVYKDDATGEILNIRRNTNKLLLVATTGGENYKIFNNLCQGERLATAVSLANQDVNALNRSVVSKAARLTGMRDSLNSIHAFDKETEQALLEIANKLQAVNAKLADLIAIAVAYNNYADTAVVSPIPVNQTVEQLESLLAIVRTYNRYANTAVAQPVEINKKAEQLESLLAIAQAYNNTLYKTIETVPTTNAKLSKLETLMQLCKAHNAQSIEIMANIPTTNTVKIQSLISLYKQMQVTAAIKTQIATAAETLKQRKTALVEVAKAKDWRICPNCGDIVTADAMPHEHI